MNRNTASIYEETIKKKLSIFFILMALLCALLAPSNPDHGVPLIPEFLSVFFFSIFVYLRHDAATPTQQRLSRHQKFLMSFLFILIFAYILPRLIWSIENTPHQVWNPCKDVAPSIFVRLECYVNGSIFLFPGPRQFYMIFTAALLGTLSAYAGSRSKDAPRHIFHAIAIFAVLYCIVVSVGIGLGQETLLPKIIGKSEFGARRFSLIITNPGWVWPYLAPGFASLIWLSVSAQGTISRITFVTASAIVAAGIFKTGQRGGLLLLGTSFVILLCYLMSRAVSRKSISKKSMYLLSGAIILSLYIVGPSTLEFALSLIGRSSFIDSSRLNIWRLAVPHVLSEHPFFGFGFASWFQEYRTIVGKTGAPLFDTAHSLYVQMLFEHGILGSFIILSLFAGILITVRKSLRSIEDGGLLFLLAIATFVCCTVVQEIDYIRPTFYTHALFWGALLGFSSTEVQPVPQSESSSFKSTHRLPLALMRIIKTRTIILSLSILAGTCATFLSYYLPFGVYAFEADISKKSDRVERWASPYSRLISFGSNTTWYFPITPSTHSSVQIKHTQHEACSKLVVGSQHYQLPIKNHSKIIPTAVKLDFKSHKNDVNRYLAARIQYPPITTQGNSHPTSAQNVLHCAEED